MANFPMSVLGVGIYLVHPDRIKNLIVLYGDRFIKRIFLETEITYAQSMRYPYLHLSTRFAAKQAFKNAIGTEAGYLSYRDIEITRMASGAPKIKLYGRALQQSNDLKVLKIHVSLSYTSNRSAAFVVLT
jgi:holo-[acyl-carrier protein] synthase